MVSNTLQEELDHIVGYANTMMEAVRLSDERRFMLEPLLEDDQIKTELDERFRNTYGAHGYNRLVPLLGHDFLRDLARSILDDGKKVASFVNLYRKVSVPRILSGFRERFRGIPKRRGIYPLDGSGLTEEQLKAIHERILEQDCEAYAEDFDRTWILTGEAIVDLGTDETAGKVDVFRDKYLAHLEMAPLGGHPGLVIAEGVELSYQEMFDFSDRYLDPVFELVRILTGCSHDVEEIKKAHKRVGKDMWRIFAGLPESLPESG